MFSVQHQFAVLVVNGGVHRDDARRALGFEFGDGEGGVERVAGVDGFQELGLHFDEADQRFADHVGEQACAGRGEAQDLQAVGEQALVALGAAIFFIVVDRVVVAGDGLEGREVRVGDRARGEGECFAGFEILETALRHDPVVLRVEFAHRSISINFFMPAASKR